MLLFPRIGNRAGHPGSPAPRIGKQIAFSVGKGWGKEGRHALGRGTQERQRRGPPGDPGFPRDGGRRRSARLLLSWKGIVFFPKRGTRPSPDPFNEHDPVGVTSISYPRKVVPLGEGSQEEAMKSSDLSRSRQLMVALVLSLLWPALLSVAGETAGKGSPGMGARDGKVFVMDTGDMGKKADCKDTVTFRKGKFRSQGCDQYGFGDAVYTTATP